MLLVTCPFGLSSLLGTECKRLGYQPRGTFPTGCWVIPDTLTDIYMCNLRLRTANKVFFELAQGDVTTFEDLFQLVKQTDLSAWLYKDTPISIEVITQDAPLHAVQSIQSVAHKAFLEQQASLAGNTEMNPPHRGGQKGGNEARDILILLQGNTAHLLINTSGASLHERGYRKYQSDASLKEHLASAVVLLSNRRFHTPLRDPCCGGGTLLIEAARIAANIPPGNHRYFAFQEFPNYDRDIRKQLLADADAKRIEKPWTFIGSDLDADMVQAARENAELAGVSKYITFVHQDVCAMPLPAPLDAHIPTTVIANPPYDMRMQSDQTKRIHQRLATLIMQKGRSGAVISAYAQAKSIFLPSWWKHNEIRQGATPAFIYSKKM